MSPVAASVKWWNSTKIFNSFFFSQIEVICIIKTIEMSIKMYFYGYFQTDVLIFSSHLDRLKQLHGKILSLESRILAVQKRDPVLLELNFLHVITGCHSWRVYNTAKIWWHDVRWIFKMSGKYLTVSDVLSGIWKSVILIPVNIIHFTYFSIITW